MGREEDGRNEKPRMRERVPKLDIVNIQFYKSSFSYDLFQILALQLI